MTSTHLSRQLPIQPILQMLHHIAQSTAESESEACRVSAQECGPRFALMDQVRGLHRASAECRRRFDAESGKAIEQFAGSDLLKRAPISDELLELMAEKFRMLSDPTRLAILRSLMVDGEMNVSQLVVATQRSVANVSKHLKLLADAGLLARQKQGSFVLYRVDDPIIARMCEQVCDSLHREFETQLKRSRRLLEKRPRD